jgi:hypothetical protein
MKPCPVCDGQGIWHKNTGAVCTSRGECKDDLQICLVCNGNKTVPVYFGEDEE